MKICILFLFSIVTLSMHGQIISNERTSNKLETENKIKTKREETTHAQVEVFAGASPAYTFRTLEVNEGIFAKPLGIRAKEVAEWTISYHAGVRTRLNPAFKLEIGAGYYTNRESFDFTEIDTVFRYVNTYRHISFPIRLAYVWGESISFYGAIGIVPKAFLSMRHDETVLDLNNNEATSTIKERDKHNLFLLDGVATVGTQIKLNPHYGIYFMLEGRKQFTNNYVRQAPYIRKAYALGFHLGVEVYLGVSKKL